MRQFLAFVKKEFYHVFRDRKTLLMLFGVPVVQIILFGFALTNEIKNSGLIICDQAHDPASQQIISKLRASEQFQIKGLISNPSDIESGFRKGNVKLAILFPAHFAANLAHDHFAQVRIIADASDPNTATTLTGYASRIIGEYQQELMNNSPALMQINTEIRMYYNPELKSTVNFVPGVMALILLLVCVMMTSVSIVREKETGTMEVLLVSPVNPFLVILAKAIPYLLLSLVNLTVILGLSIFMLKMPVNGSMLLLYGVSTLFIITALSLGLLISNSTSSQQAAMLIALMGMMVPTILFTGFMFPLENMPYALQLVANIVPSKWYYIIIKAIMVKGLGFSAIWREVSILAGMTILLLAINYKKFKIRLA